MVRLAERSPPPTRPPPVSIRRVTGTAVAAVVLARLACFVTPPCTRMTVSWGVGFSASGSCVIRVGMRFDGTVME